ncbi:PIG-L deacetylase family protein [Actinomadura atramentaria]|uniref:PIG-L deacetylase family protein n=1 Tax=Actinomadura atramentaria TaxID=1990 RepID=UPI00037C2203|nr:PIG-L deacetylase family protein [Actinomadura atramentaria]
MNLPTDRAPLGLAPGGVALMVATHPDDETLGAGGTLHRMAQAGLTVHVLAVACCTHRMWGGYSDVALRTKEFHAACDALGVAGRAIGWADDDRARAPGRHQKELVDLVESGTEVSLTQVAPDVLLMPAGNAFHQDHRAVHAACLAAVRPGGSARPTPRIVLGYAGPEDSWTPNAEQWSVFVDTTASWPAKGKALAAYGSQLRGDGHPRSVSAIRTLDAAHGISIGVPFAERFVPYRVAS